MTIRDIIIAGGIAGVVITATAIGQEAPPPSVMEANTAAVQPLQPEPTPPLDGTDQPVVAPTQEPQQDVPRDRSDQPVAAQQPHPADAAVRRARESHNPWYHNPAAALAAVLAVIIVATLMVRRLGVARRLGGGNAVQVLSKTYFSPKQSVALIRVGRRLMLVGVTPDHISHLTTFDGTAEIEELTVALQGGPASDQAFDGMLDQEAALFDTQDAELDDEPPAVLDHTRDQVQQLTRRVRLLRHSTIGR